MAAINILWIVLACIGSYLFGSIPFSVWIGKLATGTDLRDKHVKNPGGMNAVLTYGIKIGLPILLLDFFKGTASIALLDHVFALDYFIAPDGSNIWHSLATILGSMCCIAGHNYPVWLKFEGGQGLGVYMGTIWYLNPIVFVFYSVAMILVMVYLRLNLRIGTMFVLFGCIILIMFIQINPPWTMMPYNRFLGMPDFLQLKQGIILLAMFLMIFLRALQAILQKKQSATWTISKTGEQEFQ